MSQDQKDLILGRVVRERKAAQEALDLLTSEAGSIGQTLIEIGVALSSSTAEVTPEKMKEAKWDRVLILARDIEDAAKELGRCRREAIKHGLETMPPQPAPNSLSQIQ